MAFDHRFIDTALAQLGPDAYGTAASFGPAGDIVIGVAVVALQTGLRQLAYDAFDAALSETAGAQLQLQLPP